MKKGPAFEEIIIVRKPQTWFSVSNAELYGAAANSIMIARMVANIQNG